MKMLFGKKIKEIRRILAHYDELEAEVQWLKSQVKKLQKGIEEEVEYSRTQVDVLRKKQDDLKKRSQKLDKNVQSCDKWINDTREKMWENIHYARKMNEHINHLYGKTKTTDEQMQRIWKKAQRVDEKAQRVDEKVQRVDEKVQRVDEKVQSVDEKVRSGNKWIEDTRNKMWDISKNLSKVNQDFYKWKGETNIVLRKNEYKLKRYMPEEKYEMALEDWYYEVTGKDIDIRNPKTYNEITQWMKLFDNTEEKSRLADKYAVRKWVAEKIGEEYLIPLLGVWEKAEDVDFEQLPEQFVLKCNHGSSYNIIVKDKKEMKEDEIRRKLDGWLHENFAFKNGYEFHYARIKPCIIAEKYMVMTEGKDLPDYKFFCFGGHVFCSYTRINTASRDSDGKIGFFDRDYKLLPYYRKDHEPILEQPAKPENFHKMIELAEILAEGFSHVRVDFYNINGKIYFGEMTFTTSSGMGLFEPDEFDEILGKEWLKYLDLTERKYS